MTDFSFRLFTAVCLLIVTIFSSCKKNDNTPISSTTTVKDIDGTTYKTVQIGTQTWMAENLKVSKYRNGDPIITDLSSKEWAANTTGAFCISTDSAGNNTTYGNLYNWFAVNDNRNLCPLGWHVPSDVEWTTLENFLGGSTVGGGKMKSTSTLWLSPNTGATNESGFSGLPIGHKGNNGGPCYQNGPMGIWWSSTENTTESAWYRSLAYSNALAYRNYCNKNNGLCVRCIQD